MTHLVRLTGAIMRAHVFINPDHVVMIEANAQGGTVLTTTGGKIAVTDGLDSVSKLLMEDT